MAKDEVEEIGVDPTAERSEVSLIVPGSDVPNKNETSNDVIVCGESRNCCQLTW